MTVKAEFGEVELPTDPQAALGMYTTDVDILITLGYPFAKSQPIRGDSGYTTFPSYFPQAELAGVTPFANYPDFNYEKILAAQPDFILNGLGYDKKTDERLKEIGATYTVNAFDGRNWREHFKGTAAAPSAAFMSSKSRSIAGPRVCAAQVCASASVLMNGAGPYSMPRSW